MTNKSLVRLSAIVASFLVCAPRVASADIIAFTNPGAFNIAFGGILLDVDFVQNSTGNPLPGQTSDGLFYNFSTSLDDTLKAHNVNTIIESTDGSFDDLLIDAALSNILFRAIRFQLNSGLGAGQQGTLTINVEDQVESASFQFPLTGPGDFFFGAIGINGQLIDTVTLSGIPMNTVHNISIGDPIPEPGTLLLLGVGLTVGVAKVRNRRRAG